MSGNCSKGVGQLPSLAIDINDSSWKTGNEAHSICILVSVIFFSFFLLQLVTSHPSLSADVICKSTD